MPNFGGNLVATPVGFKNTIPFPTFDALGEEAIAAGAVPARVEFARNALLSLDLVVAPPWGATPPPGFGPSGGSH